LYIINIKLARTRKKIDTIKAMPDTTLMFT
jgi:uncharacterized protein YlzI (FlbEa/FlbD family)